MKFVDYMERITGIDAYGMIGLLIFFSIFILMAVYAYTADSKFIDMMKHSPLDTEEK